MLTSIFHKSGLLFAFAMIITVQASAQCNGPSGVFLYGNNSESGQSITRTQDDGFLLAGLSGQYGPGLLDWLIIKTNSQFELVWSRAIGYANTNEGGKDFMVHELSNGQIVAIGFQLMPGRRGTIMLLSSVGEVIWAKGMPGINTTPREILEMPGGGFLVVGTVQVPEGNSDDAFFAKFSMSGDVEWSQRFDGGVLRNDHFFDVKLHPNGNIIIAGSSEGHNSIHGAQIVTVSQTGTVLSQIMYNNGFPSRFMFIEPLSGGGYLASGHEDVGQISNGLVMRLNDDFSIVWQRKIRRDLKSYISDLRFDVDGNVIAGFSSQASNGSKNVGLFKLDVESGEIMSSNFASLEESIGAEFVARNFSDHSEDGMVVIGTRENKLGVLAFNSCLDFTCSSDYEYITEIPNYPIIQYSIPMGILQPMLDVNPVSMSIQEMPTTTSCDICDAEFSVTTDESCVGIPVTFTLSNQNFDNDEILSISWTFQNGQSSFSIQPSIIFSTPGQITYSAQITTLMGCEYIVNGNLNLIESTVNLVGNLDSLYAICSGETLSINLSGVDAEIINMDNGQIVPNNQITSAGNYQIMSSEGCNMVLHDFNVTFSTLSLDPFNNNQQICPNQDTLIIGFQSTENVYLWQNGSTSPSIQIWEPGTFDVLVTSADGICFENFNFNIYDQEHQNLQLFEFDSYELCAENELIIFPENSSYLLTFDDGSQGYFLNPSSSGTYQVSYNDGCYIYTETVQVYVGSCMCPMYVPNAFTPNADGLNEIFKPVVDCPVYDYELLIFDRWGELIYTSQDINIGWAGQAPRNIHFAQNEVYTYSIKYNQRLNQLKFPFHLLGHVTLIR